MNPLQQAREKFENIVGCWFTDDIGMTNEETERNRIARIMTALKEYETTLREILAREVKEQMPPEKAKGSDATAEAMLKGMRHQSEIAQDIIKSKYL